MFKLITAPAEEPITLTQAKLQCRVDGSDEDALFTGVIIPAARHMAEQRTGQALVTQTWELALDAFPSAEIEIEKPPVQSITSVKYLDIDGVEQTVSSTDYALDGYGSMQHRVIPDYGYSWPSSQSVPNAVKVRFVAGFGLATAVPEDIKAWLLLAIGTLYANRETVTQGQAELPGAFWQSLLDPYIRYRM